MNTLFRLGLILAVLGLAALLFAACQPTPLPPTIVSTPAPLGSPGHPIKILFVPAVDAKVLLQTGASVAEALSQSTGYTFTISVPTSYAATVEAACASPDDTMAFLPGLTYVLGKQLCGLDVSMKAFRYGYPIYWGVILVRRDGDIKTLQDLNGKKWAYPDAASTAGYLYPKYMFTQAGLQPGSAVAVGSHTAAAKAVYNGEADFGTTFFSPPTRPEGMAPWKNGEPPDVTDDAVSACVPGEEEGTLMCSGWVVHDSRSLLGTEAPDIMEKVRVLAMTEAIPNDGLTFGPQFAPEVRAKVEAALLAFAKTEGWKTSLGSAVSYAWTDITTASDAEYDSVRKAIEGSGLTLENLGE